MYNLPPLVSQLGHLMAFRIEKPKAQFRNCMFITSIDVDVGNRKLAIVNGGKNDRNVNDYLSEYQIGEIEEAALPFIIKTLNNFEIPATFAIRGQVTEVTQDENLISYLQRSPVRHDIAAHGYSHRRFTDLTYVEAENELRLISVGMRKFGISPKSFIFPRNRVTHLSLLEKYGYQCYRSQGGLMRDCMRIEKIGSLYDVHPSIYVDRSSKFLREMLNIAISKRLPFHIWFHLWSFGQGGSTQSNIDKILVPLLAYAKTQEKNGLLMFETMISATQQLRKHLDL